MIENRGVLGYIGWQLDTCEAASNHQNLLFIKHITLFIIMTMNNLPFEILKAREIWIEWVIKHPISNDEIFNNNFLSPIFLVLIFDFVFFWLCFYILKIHQSDFTVQFNVFV